MSVAMSKHLEVRDGITDVLKGRTEGERGTELFPQVPLSSGRGGSRRNDAKGDCLLRSAEIAEESIVGGVR